MIKESQRNVSILPQTIIILSDLSFFKIKKRITLREIASVLNNEVK